MLCRMTVAVACALACWISVPASAQPQQQTEPRIAFVVGNSAYARAPVPVALNDAGLVAEALRSIGFEIVEGGDLNQPDMLRAFRDFLAKVEAGGPDALAFVYFSGYALAFEGENFLLGIDARLEREGDLAIEAMRLSDLMRSLAGTKARAKTVIVDASRPVAFAPQGPPLARGLAALEPPDGVLLAYSAAPGTLAPDGQGPYGAYATAIAEMLRAPGLELDTAFAQIRIRAHQTTQGQQTPWHMSALGDQIVLVPPAEAGASAPPPPRRVARPTREMDPDEAYAVAIEVDTLDGYAGFVEAYPQHAYSERVWAIIRARREALAWMRARQIDEPPAYWTYLRRYPNGIYARDAERRLRRLQASFGPPPGFGGIEFDDVPMPLMGEPVEYIEVYRVGPPPPRRLIGPPPAFFVSLPPPRPRRPGQLFLPVAVPLPAVPRLAPAPRFGPPRAAIPPRSGAQPRPGGAPPPGFIPPQRPGLGAIPPGRSPPGRPVPQAVVPGQQIVPPSAVRPQPPGGRPGGPQWDRRGLQPGVAARPPAPQSAPGVAPASPPQPPPPQLGRRPQPGAPGVTPSGLNRPAPASGVVNRPPPPPPGVANRPPPPAAINRPVPPVARPAAPPPPTARPAPPPMARPAAPPPPRPAAPAAAGCPPGKSMKSVGGRQMCA